MSIKRIDPKATFKLVSQFDESIVEETAEELTVREEGKPDYMKPSRWSKYTDSFDLNDLKFKEGEKPTFFHVRCLRASELAEINQKYQTYDVVNKKLSYRDQNQMMLEIFDRAVIGIEEDGGKIEKVTADEVGFHVAVEIGSLISMMTTLGKNLKKP